jgi:hypothetical protein
VVRCVECRRTRSLRSDHAAAIAAGRESGRCRECACARRSALAAAMAAANPPRGVLCRHCRTFRVNRPRGLCWSCYRKPGVKGLYPPTSKYASRGLNDFCRRAPLPPAPTPHPPGSAGKVEAMAARALAGEELFHPRDSTWDEFYAGRLFAELVGGGVCGDESCDTGEDFP